MVLAPTLILAIDDFRLFRMQRQSAFSKARRKSSPQCCGLVFITTVTDRIIGITLEQYVREVPAHPAAKARYLILLFAETSEARYPRRQELIANVLDDLARLSDSIGDSSATSGPFAPFADERCSVAWRRAMAIPRPG